MKHDTLFIVCVFLLVINVLPAAEGNPCGQLFITVSAKETKYIELNWDFTCYDNAPNKIKLFGNDPEEINEPALLTIQPKVPEGYYVTTISYIDTILPGGWEDYNDTMERQPGPLCTDFHIAAYRGDRLVQKNCLQINPNWMENMGRAIEDVPLAKLFLPGTHNSACYEGALAFPAVNRFLLNQDQDVWKQLVYGIRYLDIRIGQYKPKTSSSKDTYIFWVNHDLFQIQRLIPVLQQIRSFLLAVGNEIVIMDIHRFPIGFKMNPHLKHEALTNILKEYLGEFIVPRWMQKPGVTPGEIWAQSKKLIISYGDDNVAKSSNFLWSPLNQKWGNKQWLDALVQYLDDVNKNNNNAKGENPLWAAMAELTATSSLIVQGFFKETVSLNHWADDVNRNLTSLFRTRWNKTTNIVASDFFLGTDMINVAIEVNKRKGTNP